MYFPLDLFGEPILPPKRGPIGRPRHRPSKASRAKVRRLRAKGCDQIAIAARLGISGPTLRLNYAVELGSTSTTGLRRVERDQSKANG